MDDEELNFASPTVIFSQSGARYHALQRVGVGGSAETYFALASSGPLRGQSVAIKFFRRLSKPEWLPAFLAEFGFLQSCSHPAVMRVFDTGVHQDVHPFVVAEYLPTTLRGAMGTSMPMVAKLGYSLQLLSALDYLAGLKPAVVHRDIKPENIFIKGGSCVLGDFGLMKAEAADERDDREIFKASIGPGMPRSYRTPDLVRYLTGGPAPIGRSDVYQAGLVLAELFSGRNPQAPIVGPNYADPVVLDDFAISGQIGKLASGAIRDMLRPAPEERPTASQMIDVFEGLFLEAAERSHALEGRVV